MKIGRRRGKRGVREREKGLVSSRVKEAKGVR